MEGEEISLKHLDNIKELLHQHCLTTTSVSQLPLQHIWYNKKVNLLQLIAAKRTI
uniref:Uncharacterized protein n=1 Tax=Arion vulgaris TaxID=1028688 RepID=A0A0B6Y1V6_9EUPU